MARPRGRPRKNPAPVVEKQVKIENEEIQIMSELPAVKQMIRNISRQNVTDLETGVDSVLDVDAELNEYYAKGYKLFDTHYLGEVPEAYMVMYILVLV